MPRANLIGRTFGLLTVVSSLQRDRAELSRGQRVSATCACGSVWTGRADTLKRGATKSCGCLPHGIKPNDDVERAALNKVLFNYQRHARRRSLAWMLLDSEFYSLIKGNCYYCGAAPSRTFRMVPKPPRKTGSVIVYNGVDRRDNKAGYTSANVVSCCATCNFAKRDLSEEAFLMMVRAISVRHPAAEVSMVVGFRNG